MKNTFLRLFVALMAMVILCTQLPLGYLTGANAVLIQPTDYPSRTVVKLNADLQYTGMVPNAAQTETKFITPVDFTSEDYDYFEFDMLVSPSSAFTGTVVIALFDEGGSLATYSLDVPQNQWIDVKIATGDFVLDGIDMKNVVGYRINNPESWVQYKCVNLCLTGIMRPTDIPEGDVDYLAERIDVVDNKTNSSNSDVFDFDEIESADFFSKDWLEFDIYVLGGGEDSVAANMGLAFTDVNFDPVNSIFGKNTVYLSSISVMTNKWNHIKIPTNNFKVGDDCKTDEIVGFRITNMKDNYRYILGNVILKTALVNAPEIPEDAVVVSEGEIIQYYSVTAGSDAGYKPFENTVDLSNNDHVVVDIYADSAVEGVQKVCLSLKDIAGDVATAYVDINPGEWVNAKILIDAFDTDSAFDFSKVEAINISQLEKTTRYFVSNFYLTDAVYSIADEYPYNATQKFDSIDMDYFADVSNDASAESYIDFGAVYDLNSYDYVEFDLFVDTPLDSTDLPTTFELNFVDSNGKNVNGSRDYTYNEVQHIRMLVSALVTAGENYGGDKSAIKGFRLENAFADSRYIIKNFCFTKILVPEPPTKDVILPLLKFSDITPIYQHFYDYDVVFDGLERGTDNEDGSYDTTLDSYDITIGEEKAEEYLEFDIYVVLDESSKHYAEELTISFKMCDRPNYNRHASENGRAHASFTVNTNEWSHVRIALSSFGKISNTIDCDFNKVARYFLEGNAAGTRYIVANMCIGNRETLPVDTDKPSMPEKSGVRYVTDCDSANSSQNGVWTSSHTQFTTDYKTEGKGSALLKVMNQETVAMNSHRFLFSSPADLSKSKNIKFDLFIDDTDLASTCSYKVYLSSDRRNTADNFIYNINPSELKLGWNSFDIPLSFFKEEADEAADWSAIQCFAVEVILNKPFKSYGSLEEYFLLCLDNIRISDTYVLQEELEDSTDSKDNEDSSDTDNELNGSINGESHTTYYNNAEVITLSPEENTTYITQRVIKKQKVVLDTIAQSHWIVLIVTCCVAVILIAGSIVLVILSSRKNKLGGSK